MQNLLLAPHFYSCCSLFMSNAHVKSGKETKVCSSVIVMITGIYIIQFECVKVDMFKNFVPK